LLSSPQNCILFGLSIVISPRSHCPTFPVTATESA
jgi:hypothetical protein